MPRFHAQSVENYRGSVRFGPEGDGVSMALLDNVSEMKWRKLTHFPVRDFERRCTAYGSFGQSIWKPDFETYSAFVYATAVPEPQWQSHMNWPYNDCSQLTVEQGPSLTAIQLAQTIVDRRMILAMRSFKRVIKTYSWNVPFAELFAFEDAGDPSNELEQETWFVVDRHNASSAVVEAVLDSPLGNFSLGFLGYESEGFDRRRPVHELSSEEAMTMSKNIVALIAICYDETVPVVLVGPNDYSWLFGNNVCLA